MAIGDILWQPNASRVAQTQMHAFMQRVHDRHSVPMDWASLRRWSIDSAPVFWAEMLEFAEIQTAGNLDPARTDGDMLSTRWFPNATLNYARHLLRFDGEEAALTFELENGQAGTLSRGALRAAVARYQVALKSIGVKQGDRVAGYLPNLPETIIAMLAATSLGAIWSSGSPDFGSRAILDRFGQIEPRVLFSVDQYHYGGKSFAMNERLREVADGLPTLERVVMIPYDASRPITTAADDVRNGVLLSQFLPSDAPPAPEFVDLPFDHPLFIMYSSGTTGVPKCITHGHGGTLLQHMKELMLHCDLRAGERIFYFTTCGWMMWNWLVSGLGVGATVGLFEGNPAYPTVNRLWEFAERERINAFGTSPKFLGACQKAGLRPVDEYSLNDLRLICSTGSPLSAELFEWAYDAVKSDLQLSSISGGTDIISCFMLGNPILPVRSGEIQCCGLAMDVQAWNDARQPVIGEKGELVCTSPFPSQPVGFWGDDATQSKYRNAYFGHYPDRCVWRHGDFIELTETGGVLVYGRSDATLNPGGVRIGTAEIYRLVEALPEVVDSIVVGRRLEDDVAITLFVVLAEGVELSVPLRKQIRQVIADGASKRHVPRTIEQVASIPYTISGKKVELAVEAVLHHEPVTNRDALANPESLDEYAQFANGNGHGRTGNGGRVNNGGKRSS